MTGFTWPDARAQLELLVEAPHAPFERELRGVLLLLEAGEPEARDQVGAEQVALVPAGQLEDAAPDREDARALVGDDEARAGRGVVVVDQLEEEAEAAVAAGDGLVENPSTPSMSIERCLQFGQMK